MYVLHRDNLVLPLCKMASKVGLSTIPYQQKKQQKIKQKGKASVKPQNLKKLPENQKIKALERDALSFVSSTRPTAINQLGRTY